MKNYALMMVGVCLFIFLAIGGLSCLGLKFDTRTDVEKTYSRLEWESYQKLRAELESLRNSPERYSYSSRSVKLNWEEQQKAAKLSEECDKVIDRFLQKTEYQDGKQAFDAALFVQYEIKSKTSEIDKLYADHQQHQLEDQLERDPRYSETIRDLKRRREEGERLLEQLRKQN